MVSQHDFQRIDAYTWELSRDFDGQMEVPARIFGNHKVFQAAFGDRSIEQLVNVAMLPGIVKYAMAMPDMHQGYGFPIGGVAAFDCDGGIVSPGGVGYDINCGVRMLASALDIEDVAPHLDDLATALYRNCPSGVGGKGAVRLSYAELDRVLGSGAGWARSQGYARQDDLDRTESGGRMPEARADAVPDRAKERGVPQLGSLGSGNHFLEVDVVDTIFDAAAAGAFGLRKDQVVVQIHCGSRGLGHEVCSQYLKRLQAVAGRYKVPLPDRELISAPIASSEGRDYVAAMSAAANYAFANRQVLAHFVRRSFEEVLAGKVGNWDLTQVYDVTHNMAKFEDHVVDGQLRKLIVHRKGATRAFPAGHPDLTPVYRGIGQPVLVPGSMGTTSYVLVGDEAGMALSFGSSCHGAGRTMSRRAATRQVRGEAVRSALREQGIAVRARSMRGLAEEAPLAYKDVSEVVESVVGARLARQVARVHPVAVIKG
jgi:tRNA-splicing ligase RtcB (3'-phosphate/5'-hydroxy nucleic acid ligase)